MLRKKPEGEHLFTGVVSELVLRLVFACKFSHSTNVFTVRCDRREELKEKLREKLELEKRAVKVVERLLEDSVAEDFLTDCVSVTQRTHSSAFNQNGMKHNGFKALFFFLTTLH